MSSSPMNSVAGAAKDFEQQHYQDTNAAGETEQLSGQDFKDAAASAGDAVSNAANAVTGAIAGEVRS